MVPCGEAGGRPAAGAAPAAQQPTAVPRHACMRWLERHGSRQPERAPWRGPAGWPRSRRLAQQRAGAAAQPVKGSQGRHASPGAVRQGKARRTLSGPSAATSCASARWLSSWAPKASRTTATCEGSWLPAGCNGGRHEAGGGGQPTPSGDRCTRLGCGALVGVAGSQLHRRECPAAPCSLQTCVAGLSKLGGGQAGQRAPGPLVQPHQHRHACLVAQGDKLAEAGVMDGCRGGGGLCIALETGRGGGPARNSIWVLSPSAAAPPFSGSEDSCLSSPGGPAACSSRFPARCSILPSCPGPWAAQKKLWGQ